MATSGGADSENLQIQDPNSFNQKDKLTGADAFNQIVASSSLGKTTLPFGTRDYLTELANNLKGGSGAPGTEDGTDHADSSEFGFDPTKGGQSEARLYTAQEDLSAEEINVFNEKVKDLKAAKIIGNSAIPYVARGWTDIAEGKVIKATNERQSGSLKYDSSSDLDKINGKHIYPCASLIEFLLQINSKIILRGDFDLGRTDTTAGGNGVTINDHSTGRGIDIFEIGKDEASIINLRPKNVENNKKALDLLMETIATMDESLHPDLIVFDDRIAADYGIISGAYEIDSNKSRGVNGIIQKNYTSLKKIDFYSNDGHQDHFHIAFSPQRAGNYIDYTESSSGSGWGEGYPSGLSFEELAKVPDLFQPRVGADGSALKDFNALYQALVGFGKFKPETAAIFVMIAERESHISPAGFNGNLGTEDYSLGLWQINYFGNQDLLEKNIDTYSLVNGAIKTEKVKCYKLLFKDHAELGITNKATAVAKMREIYEEDKKKPGRKPDQPYMLGKKYADDRLFNAATQIGILKEFVARYPYSKFKNGWKFTSWGEYSGANAYGWIRDLKFQTAVDIYIKNNAGKTKEDLQKLCANLIKNMINPQGKAVFNQWLGGEVFPNAE